MRRTMIRRATIGRYRRPHITVQSKRLQPFGLGGERGKVACLNLSGWLAFAASPRQAVTFPRSSQRNVQTIFPQIPFE